MRVHYYNRHPMPSPEVQEQISLHLGFDMSTAKIAQLLGRKKNSVIHNLRNWSVLRPSLGLRMEKNVADYFTDLGYEVTRQKGDSYYDFEMNGKKYDVKSSTYNPNYGYIFEIDHALSDRTNNTMIDYYILVCMDGRINLMYLLDAKEVKVKSLHINNPAKTEKYNLQLIDYLY